MQGGYPAARPDRDTAIHVPTTYHTSIRDQVPICAADTDHFCPDLVSPTKQNRPDLDPDPYKIFVPYSFRNKNLLAQKQKWPLNLVYELNVNIHVYLYSTLLSGIGTKR
jgi:hypothetical protein